MAEMKATVITEISPRQNTSEWMFVSRINNGNFTYKFRNLYGEESAVLEEVKHLVEEDMKKEPDLEEYWPSCFREDGFIYIGIADYENYYVDYVLIKINRTPKNTGAPSWFFLKYIGVINEYDASVMFGAHEDVSEKLMANYEADAELHELRSDLSAPVPVNAGGVIMVETFFNIGSADYIAVRLD